MIPGLVMVVSWLTGWFALARLGVPAIIKLAIVTILSGLAAGLVFEMIRLAHMQKSAEKNIQRLSHRADQLTNQMAGVYALSSLYAKPSTEKEIITALLKLCIDLVGARGASFVPLDDQGQPMAAQTQGELPFPALDAWVEYLASPAIRQRCEQCQSYGHLNTSCPLLKSPITDVIGLFCLPLNSGNREWGIMNLYMPNHDRLDPDTEIFVKTLLQDTALALESRRLRQREFDAIQQLRLIQQRTDLSGLLTSLLDNIRMAFGAELAQVELTLRRDRRRLSAGETNKIFESEINQIVERILLTGEAVEFQTTNQWHQSSFSEFSILAVPLLSSQKQVKGTLLVVTPPILQNQTHQLSLLQAFADQVELVIENAELLAHIEYQTVIQERTRLAREIHDGLAQTVGLLKLQTAQSLNYLSKADTEKLRFTLTMVHNTLSEAYQDIRSTIDGLRIDTDPHG
ncbi:MAG TPA: histidine kinase, partial [Anaerolineales bacterium]|nr:histidine kinase [Anaerolineales bacterium]